MTLPLDSKKGELNNAIVRARFSFGFGPIMIGPKTE
jgi:hypothetical protein